MDRGERKTLGLYENIDRRTKEPGLESVDILLLTLDADIYLEKCLDSIYREISVNKIIALDGGSKDRTVEILKKYPRMELHVRPDIRTTGKALEFAFSRATTPWVAIFDADIELPEGWYDEMIKYKDKYDFFGCKRIIHYEFNRVDQTSLDINQRPMGAPWLARLECFKNYHVDDDYMWRATDILLRQVAEKAGYKFGKVSTAYHYHHTTDNLMYESDEGKKGSRLVFEEPKEEILNQKNWENRLENFRKAVVKYIDPEFVYPRNDEELLLTLLELDDEWVRETNIKWHNILNEYRKKKKKPRMAKFRRICKLLIMCPPAMIKAFYTYIKQIREVLK